ncbi:MAG: phosphatase PAP2 family protein [Gammaproteobacteria bacterium]|nr:MAG: phosphatase PAP2 family protein [Gammaproteobacteria bacterium]
MRTSDWGVPVTLLVLAVSSQYSGLDVWLASHFYDATSGTWPWRDTWLTSTLLHTDARRLITAVGVGMLLGWLASLVRPGLASHRRYWGYLLLASLSGPIVVAALKSVTHLYTPWDVTLFGGELPHLRLFDPVPKGAPFGHAFPAGHASAGYAFFSLYFLARSLRPALQWKALAVPVVLGLVLGVDQQVRGAHFLSHDLTTAALCWMLAALWARVLLSLQPRVRAETAIQPA